MRQLSLRIPLEMTRLGASVRELRLGRGVTLRAAAASCDLTPSYLAKLERGRTFQTIGLATLVKLAQYYAIPVVVLLRDAGFVDDVGEDLPDFELYLQRKYRLPPAAIRDLVFAHELIEKKYGVRAR